MSTISNKKRYLKLMHEFSDSEAAPALIGQSFQAEFLNLWRSDLDEELAEVGEIGKQQSLKLQKDLIEGVITSEVFSKRWNQLWKLSPVDAVFRSTVDAIASACSIYDAGITGDDVGAYYYSEEQLRAFVKGALFVYELHENEMIR